MSPPGTIGPAYRNQRGYLLFDMLITMVIITTLFSICSVWIHKTFLYCSEVNEREMHQRTISRISRELRSEASLAESISISSGTVSLVRGDESSTYKIAKTSVTCIRINGEITRRDRFTFSKNARLKWLQSENTNQITLEIRRDFSAYTANRKACSKLDALILVRAGNGNRRQQ